MTDTSDEEFFSAVTQSAKMLRRKKAPLKPRRQSEPKFNLNFSLSGSSTEESDRENRPVSPIRRVPKQHLSPKKSPLKNQNEEGNLLIQKIRFLIKQIFSRSFIEKTFIIR